MQSLAAVVKTVKGGKSRMQDTPPEIITVIQVRGDGGLDEDGGYGNEEMWLDSRYILKQVLTVCFEDWIWGVKERRTGKDSKLFGLSNCKNEITIH